MLPFPFLLIQPTTKIILFFVSCEIFLRFSFIILVFQSESIRNCFSQSFGHVRDFISPNNPFLFRSIVPAESSIKLLNSYNHGLTECIAFRNERFVRKEKKLSDSIKRNDVTTFLPKNETKSKTPSSTEALRSITKKLGKAQRNIDSARSLLAFL